MTPLTICLGLTMVGQQIDQTEILRVNKIVIEAKDSVEPKETLKYNDQDSTINLVFLLPFHVPGHFFFFFMVKFKCSKAKTSKVNVSSMVFWCLEPLLQAP